MTEQQNNRKLTPIWRIILEASFIVFLFYSNLLMGEFTRSGLGQQNGFWWAIENVFTETNFIIALATAFIGHLFFDFFRNKL